MCHNTSPMRSQHCGSGKAITYAKVDPDLCRHMASLDHIKLSMSGQSISVTVQSPLYHRYFSVTPQIWPTWLRCVSLSWLSLSWWPRVLPPKRFRGIWQKVSIMTSCYRITFLVTDVITDAWLNINGGLTKPPLELGHAWIITSHINLQIWLLIHAIQVNMCWAWRDLWTPLFQHGSGAFPVPGHLQQTYWATGAVKT